MARAAASAKTTRWERITRPLTQGTQRPLTAPSPNNAFMLSPAPWPLWLAHAWSTAQPGNSGLESLAAFGAGACPAHIMHSPEPTCSTVLLNAGGTQAVEAVPVHLRLPVQELLRGQPIAGARVAHREQATTHGSHHDRFARRHPALGVRRGQIGEGKHGAIRSEHPASESRRSHHQAIHAVQRHGRKMAQTS